MKEFIEGSKGQVGTGTLMIFLAMILASAVAAGVILRTSSMVESTATATGSDTSNEVITGLQVTEVVGYSSNRRNITSIGLTVGLVPGGVNINYDDILLAFQSGDTYITGILHELSPNAGVNNFSVTFIRNNTNDYVLEKGEVAQIWFDLESNPTAGQVPTGEEFSITLLPIGGQAIGVTKYVPRGLNQMYVVDW